MEKKRRQWERMAAVAALGLLVGARSSTIWRRVNCCKDCCCCEEEEAAERDKYSNTIIIMLGPGPTNNIEETRNDGGDGIFSRGYYNKPLVAQSYSTVLDDGGAIPTFILHI